MAKFCGKCGTKLDEVTRLCPNCNIEQVTGKNVKEKDARNVITRKDKKRRKKNAIKLALLLVLGGSVWVLNHFDIIKYSDFYNVLEKLGINSDKSSKEEAVLYIPEKNDLALDKESGKVYVNNIIIIFFEQGVAENEVNSTIASIEGTVVGSIPIIDQYQVQINPCTLKELDAICNELKGLDCVFDAVYDEAFELEEEAVPNDPWTKTWFAGEEIWAESVPYGANWWLEAIDAPSVWEKNSEFTTIKIGIIDNGFDVKHEDLKNKIMYVSPVNNKAKHGTHVAGIIGAEANNEKGITGIVWNSELYTYDWQLDISQEVADYVFNTNWSTFNQIYGGTIILREKGAKIINVSVGVTKTMLGYSE